VAPVILIDTHVLVWSYVDPFRLLPAAVRERLDGEQLVLSPFVSLELRYLHEVGRLTVSAADVEAELSRKLELGRADPSSAQVCAAAADLDWTRDPFDRLLSAHAVVAGIPLVTKDRIIRKNLPLAWWPD
jgi:PIN domain nuclease of toxin-antitoxin system